MVAAALGLWLLLAPAQVVEPYGLTLLLQLPAPLPQLGGGVELRSLAAVRINRGGQILLLGRYARPAASAATAAGLFLLEGERIVPVLLEDQQTVLAGGQGFSDFRQPLLNDAGTIVVTARRVDGAAGRDVIVRIEPARLTVLLAGEQPLATGLNDRGQVLFEADGALRLWSGEGVKTLAAPGQRAVGTDGEWIEARRGSWNEAGQVVFWGRYWRQGSPAEGVWSVDAQSGQIWLLAKFADPVPGYYPLTFASFGDPVITDGGVSAFPATTAGRLADQPAGSHSRVVFARLGGTLTPVGLLSGPLPHLVSVADQLYWADGDLAWRWNAQSGASVLARGASQTPQVARSGLILFSGEELTLASTLVLASAADPGRSAAILPGGSIVTGFRRLPSGAAAASGTSAETVPLPSSLGGFEIRIAGRAAPLFFAAANQVNFQAPAAAQGAQLVEMLHSGSVLATGLWLPGRAPAFFTVSQGGAGQGVALNEDGSLNAAASPALRGRAVQMFGTGAGAEFLSASGQPLTLPDGQPAPPGGSPLFLTPIRPLVRVGPAPATVLFSGLAPGLVGVWQVNFTVPLNAPAGAAVPVTVTYNGAAANPITLAVR